MSTEWGYNNDNGPHTWGKCFDPANGSNQSPIDIISKNAIYSAELEAGNLSVTVPTESTSQELKPSKHGFSVGVSTKESKLSGGPLGEEAHYQIQQFHFHWSNKDTEGSEHLLDGQAYPSEAHFVFWNSKKYNKFEEAASSPDGLAVLGLFINIAEKDNEEFAPLFDALKSMQNDDALSAKSIHPALSLEGIFQQVNINKYFTYGGSLTTPPCHESAQWFVFAEAVNLSRNQVDLLRSTHKTTTCGCGVNRNFRPPCPLNNRTVRASFK